ncbi:type IV pilin [Halobaculum sp. D14]|uniref:type IV pilin n=1 Tax=Halobaculum sp. D14 TaxID=3421642 RepID=UPI003EBD2581
MDFKQLFTDDRAVSPVIGVILMVAITVILAAVIGTFVLGLGNNLQTSPPQASFGFDYTENSNGSGYNVTATHQGGATLNSDNAKSVKLTSANGGSVSFSLPVSAGDSAQLNESNGGSGADAVPGNTGVRVIWTSSDGKTSQSLATGKTPS